MEQKQLRDSQPGKDHPGANREGPRRRRKGAPDLQPTRKRGPQSHGCEQLGSANKLSKLESLRASDRSPILLILILGDPRQRAGPSPAPPGWCGNLLRQQGQQWKPIELPGSP